MEFNDRRSFFKQHTCWNDKSWDGLLADGCEGCKQAMEYPCEYCGYGHAFTTHNGELHAEEGDPLANQLGEEKWEEMFHDKPYFPS